MKAWIVVEEPAPSDQPDAIMFDRLRVGIEMLPCLTRTVFLLHRTDGRSYDEIAWRCGISVDEVTERMADALFTVRRSCDGDRALSGRVRLAFRPWRVAWYEWQRRRTDRRLGF